MKTTAGCDDIQQKKQGNDDTQIYKNLKLVGSFPSKTLPNYKISMIWGNYSSHRPLGTTLSQLRSLWPLVWWTRRAWPRSGQQRPIMDVCFLLETLIIKSSSNRESCKCWYRIRIQNKLIESLRYFASDWSIFWHPYVQKTPWWFIC